jgi:hypothetical protein
VIHEIDLTDLAKTRKAVTNRRPATYKRLRETTTP